MRRVALLIFAEGFGSSVSTPTFAAKVRAACIELGIAHEGLTAPTALAACHKAMGIEARGPGVGCIAIAGLGQWSGETKG